jgi:biopolymer transport protein ExbD
MKLKRRKPFAPEVSTSSLNDIMFFLLLFFLIVSTLGNPNVIKVLLPRSQASQVLNKQQITLTVTNQKRYYIDTKEIPFSMIKSELQYRIRGFESPTIILRFSQDLNIQDLVDILQIGVSLNAKMVLATQKS